jgi:U3 small nucleolar RNA-associated protein 22
MSEAERLFFKSEKIKIPFPAVPLQADSGYQMVFAKPANVNVIGSYALRTVSKAAAPLEIDLLVTMPSSIFQPKDYLNVRYFHKRAYYLACIAAGLQSSHDLPLDLHFDCHHGNPLLPVLVAKSPKHQKTKQPSIDVRIHMACPSGVFPAVKLLPTKNCVRSRKGQDGITTAKEIPTPFYNGSVLNDVLTVQYLQLQHEEAKHCTAFRDACILGRVWLRQRGFSSKIQDGGFGNFEWAALTALLLQSGGPKDLPLFSRGYSSYQLFKAALQYLAMRDLAKSPHSMGPGASAVLKNYPGPQFLDNTRQHNLLFKMTIWSYNLLRREAASSVAALSDSRFDQFDATFVIKSSDPICRYDSLVEVNLPPLDIKDMDLRIPAAVQAQKAHTVLVRALSDRVSLIAIHQPALQSWPISSQRAETTQGTLGFIFDSVQIGRTIDRGPSADDPKAASDFQKFWGEKAELRRFRDGSIQESLVWNQDPKQTIFRMIVTYILGKHLGQDFLEQCKFFPSESSLLQNPLGAEQALAPFQSIMNAFKEMDREVRGLEDMPLYSTAILPADPQLSYTSISSPFGSNLSRMSNPAEVMLQFEGSARWPEDMDAIQRTKAAFLLKIADLIEEKLDGVQCRVGLENQDSPLKNQSFLDIFYPNGAVFRLRIHYDREELLLERALKDKFLTSQAKLETASALAGYKRVFLRQPAHCQALQGLATRFPAFSPSVRLVKKWFSSHLLSAHFLPALIELFVANTFTNPYPWSAPTSANVGLFRTLSLLSRWDWQNEPWICDLSSAGMSESEIASIVTRYEAWRKIDPLLNRVVLFAASSADIDGTTWTDHARPPKVVAGRMTALARAASKMVKEQESHLDIDSLFFSGLDDYDVLIHLNPKYAGDSDKKRKSQEFKNLQVNGNGQSIEDAAFHPLKVFIEDLQQTYEDVLVFFYDQNSPEVIGGLWNPQTKRSWKLKLGYSSIPIDVEHSQIDMNREGILGEIAALGGDLISKIHTQKKTPA